MLKTDKPYSVVCGFMYNCINIVAILSATHCCLRGSHIPSAHMSSTYPQRLEGQALACTLSNSSFLFTILLPLSSLLLASFFPLPLPAFYSLSPLSCLLWSYICSAWWSWPLLALHLFLPYISSGYSSIFSMA